jgi:hypothetical protein
MGNAWLAEMAKTRRKYPHVKDFAKIAALAKQTYHPSGHHKNKKGGSLVQLSPSEFHANPKFPTGGAGLQLYATNFSNGGGKKSRKSRKSGKKSRKSKSCKRR